MVTLTRASSRAKKGFSPHTLVAIMLGSCLLAFSFLAGVFYNESTHYETPQKSNLRGVMTDSIKDSFHPADIARKNEKKWGKYVTRPDDWQSWGFHDVHSSFECGKHAHDHNKPMPDMEYWEFYRGTYERVVNNNIKFDSVLPTEGYTMNENGKQPYYAKISPGKGRGLFASRDIKKGELVHDGDASDIEMSADEWRKLAFALPQKMACDFSEWTWTQQTEKGGPYKIFTAFNISILMNGSKHANTMPPNSYSSKMYATRDIKKDEEILTEYSIYPTLWKKVGLGVK